MKPLPQSSKAFTLVELLAVVAVLVLLLSFTVPSVNDSMTNLNLTTQGNALGDTLAQARQMAITQNREIELRLVNLARTGTSSNPAEAKWLYQLWEIDSSNNVARPVSAAQRFSEAIIISRDLSPLLTKLPELSTNFPPHGTQTYQAIRFRPNGRIVDQFGTDNYLSLTTRHEAGSTPRNFYTLQLNPMTGGARFYRP